MRFLKAAAASLWLLILCSAGHAQSSCTVPGTGNPMQQGQVLTAAQWNGCFQQKNDTLTFSPVNKSGDTMTGELTTNASTINHSGFNIAPGVTPATPNDGDVWVNGSSVFAQASGTTYTLNMSAIVNGATTGQLAVYSGTRLISGLTGGSTDLNVGYWNSPSVASAIAMPNCTTGLTYSTSTHSFGCISAAAIVAPQGRITLTANTPVMTSTTSAATTLRYDCFAGNNVPYFNGTADLLDTISSCEVTDAMVSAASVGQVVSGNLYDMWWVHSGANRICLAMSTVGGGGGGWSADTGGSNTSRGTGYTQLDNTTRPYVTNANSIPNCFNGTINYGTVAANQATYLGTVYASANGQVSYNFGGAASGGTAGLFGVCNPYNQVMTVGNVTDSGTNYTYSSATVRQARASAGMQHQIVNCVGTTAVMVSYLAQVTTTATVTSFTNKGVGLDSTTTFFTNRGIVQAPSNNAFSLTSGANIRSLPGFGLHTYSANEQGDGTNANTMDGPALDNLNIGFMN